MQVDMVVCYDAHASPIRDMQRCGRTGRHRGGRVVQLLAVGKEEADYEKQQLASLCPFSALAPSQAHSVAAQPRRCSSVLESESWNATVMAIAARGEVLPKYCSTGGQLRS